MKRACMSILMALVLVAALPALAQTPGLEVTSPPPGATVQGQVVIEGTVDVPNMDVYFVEVVALPPGADQPASDAAWLPATLPMFDPVQDGVIATWDTTMLPDGRYALRVTASATNEAPVRAVVSPLTVANTTSAPLPVAVGDILFQSDRDGDYDIYAVDANGGNLVNLTNHDASDVHPAWSPDGTQIAFASDRDGNRDIYVMHADGSGVRRLTTDLLEDWSPAWSPDGTQIAFYSNRNGNYDIWVMDADGSNQRQLTDEDGEDRTPDWSPDGSSILFYTNRGTGQDLYVVAPDGSGLRPVTGFSGDEVLPAWSPDGRQIAYTMRSGSGGDEIAVVNADGSNMRQLTASGENDWDPAWSPDSAQILFVSRRDGDAEIYIMNADGSNPRNLTNDPGGDYSPVWRWASGGAVTPVVPVAGDAAAVVEAYIQAKIASDAGQLAALACAAWQQQAAFDALIYQNVTVEIESLACVEAGPEGPYTRVTCEGTLALTSGNETRRFELDPAAYRAVLEDGEWKMCGAE